MRTVDEIKMDIDAMHYICERIISKSNEIGADIAFNRGLMKTVEVVTQEIDIDRDYILQVAFWLYNGMSTLFLQDADSLVMKTDKLVEILNYINEKFPTINRITSYARAKTVSRKTVDELKDLRRAGLSRLHIGMESGSDRVLEIICKGVNQKDQIKAGQNAIEAGFELSEFYMPGAGGKKFSEENAVESAKVLNKINPTFIRIRTTVPIPDTPLYEQMSEGKWEPQSEEGRVREIRLFISTLSGITSSIASDHIINLLEDIEGELPDDKESMLKVIDDFLSMDIHDRELFIIGRRLGYYRYFADYKPIREVELIKKEMAENFSSIEEALQEMLIKYIAV